MWKSVFLLLIVLSGISLQSLAQGDLLVTPKRVVFEGLKQKEELNLLNLGTDTATFSECSSNSAIDLKLSKFINTW